MVDNLETAADAVSSHKKEHTIRRTDMSLFIDMKVLCAKAVPIINSYPIKIRLGYMPKDSFWD
jgi:hypothetical protein